MVGLPAYPGAESGFKKRGLEVLGFKGQGFGV